MHTKVHDEINIKKSVETENIPSANAGLTPDDKKDIQELLKEAIKTYGSARAVANRCGVSDATISLIAKNQYITQGEDMWRTVAAAIGWNKKGWVVAPDTTNIRIATQALSDAKEQSMFIPISYNAGSGKSTAINNFIKNDKTNNTFRILCRDWSRREFLIRLRIAFGLPVIVGVPTLDDMLEQIIYHLKNRHGRPLLILDQANSLKPSVFGYLIHIYNEVEDQLGLVMSGTENLEKEIKRGVNLGRRGYDEIDSRLGRKYIHLIGNTKQDVFKICQANGITDKAIQLTVWNECSPITKTIQDGGASRQISVVEDGRRIKRAIRKQIMLNTLNLAS